MKVTSLEAIEEARRIRLTPGSESDRYRAESRAKGLMVQRKLGAKLGKRPVGNRRTGTRSESLNQGLLRQSPGSSQHPGVDFVKQVYAERTGQEPMY